MTGSSRSPIRFLSVLFVLAIALVAMFALAPSAQAAIDEYYCEGSQCEEQQSVPDACPDLPGMQTAGANCTPAPAPVQADSTPDQGFIAPPPAENEHGSLTIQAAQVDPPSAVGGEVVIPGAFAAEAPGGGTTVANGGVPSGPLPYTGAVATNLAIAGVVMLWIGALSYLVAGVLRRRVAADVVA